MKILRNFSEKLATKFSATTVKFLVKIACLDVFSREGQSLQQRDKKRRKSKGPKKNLKNQRLIMKTE